MPHAAISITNSDSIIDEIMRREQMVACRAFELFQSHADWLGTELQDWFQAENELFPQPDTMLRRADGRFEIDSALPDVDPKKLEVKVTPEDVLITAERTAPASGPAPAAEAGSMPDGAVRYFLAIHLPEPIDPGKVVADYKDGMLHLAAQIAKPEARTVEIHA